jgi:hypothetical protein
MSGQHKITREIPWTRPRISLTTYTGGSGDAPAGHVPTSIGSNGQVAWGSNVATITANGSNQLQGPFVNFAAGSNITLAVSSNTMTITGTGGGGGGSALTVQDEGTPLATDATTLNFVGAGVTATGAGATKTITIPGGSGSGDYTYIDEVLVGSGGAATVSFTSIPNTYRDLVLISRVRMESSSNGENVALRLGSGGTPDTGTNYAHWLSYTGWTSGSVDNTADTTFYCCIGADADAPAGGFAWSKAEILGYSDATAWKGYSMHAYSFDGAGRLKTEDHGVWKNASVAVDIVRLTPSVGDIAEGSRFTLYGRG